MSDQYKAQDRGSRQEYLKYLVSMDSVCVDKVASASVFFSTNPGNVIVDIGMASGTTSNILAHLFPQHKIIGVDINPKMVEIARNNYISKNLEFRIDDGEKLTTFKEESVDGFFNCSSVHHITSFNGYDPNRAFTAIQRQTALLRDGGIVVVRDFVKPPEMEVLLELSTIPGDIRPCDSDLLIDFSRRARSLAKKDERGFPLKELNAQQKNTRRFKLRFSDAVEFIRRKDYFNNWDIELQEEYGYFTQKDFEEVFISLGLRIIISFPVYNPWIVKNRYRNKFSLFDKDGNNLGFPPSNYLIAAEKVINKGTAIKVTRYLPEKEDSFLNYQFYKDIETNKIYDIVCRPNQVVDILPYFIENDRIEIIAKHGYPRPIVNVDTDSPLIDQKHYSGYITEGLTASFNHPVNRILEERTNISSKEIDKIEKSLEYFTSPGGIDEKVESLFVRLNKPPNQEFFSNVGFSGFNDNGLIRKYDAIQLLKTAQTGALAEARLELNIYNLLRKLNVELPEWIGEKFEISEMPVRNITSFSDLVANKKKRFVLVNECAFYLQKHRAKFSETGVVGSSDILEYVTPQEVSINTLVTLPVVRHKKMIYVGLEIRHLPVPEKHTGNSFILVAPAVRLPKDIKTFYHLENFILNNKIFDTSVKGFHKLGEKYFPSAAITPEQVYPYVVTLAEATGGLKWMCLKELYDNPELLKDGHLLISLSRLNHALKE
ncbi:MAG: methyltransferase domain-containing protein [Bacteroidales bacterium]|nr:methyltransferase domain-containing protein [Bacteroidales bacterium]